MGGVQMQVLTNEYLSSTQPISCCHHKTFLPHGRHWKFFDDWDIYYRNICWTSSISREVLILLQDNGFTVKLSKCKCAMRRQCIWALHCQLMEFHMWLRKCKLSWIFNIHVLCCELWPFIRLINHYMDVALPHAHTSSVNHYDGVKHKF